MDGVERRVPSVLRKHPDRHWTDLALDLRRIEALREARRAKSTDHRGQHRQFGSSTRIEGNKLSDRDVEKLLSVVDIQTFNTKDERADARANAEVAVQ
jgi:hypothetical protein